MDLLNFKEDDFMYPPYIQDELNLLFLSMREFWRKINSYIALNEKDEKIKELYKTTLFMDLLDEIYNSPIQTSNEPSINSKKNIKELHKEAYEGDSKIQFELGCMYYFGKGIKESISTALDLLKKSAEQGNPEARMMITTILEEIEACP